MALLKHEPPATVNIAYGLYLKLVTLEYQLRIHKNADDRYNNIKCPKCGQHHWAHADDGDNKYLINCIVCGHEYNVCTCGKVLTEEEVSPYDHGMCHDCRMEFRKDNHMCTVCEADLVEHEQDGKIYEHCPNHCIEPVFVRRAEVILEGCSSCGAGGTYAEV